MRTAYRHFNACLSLCERHALDDVRAANLPMRSVTSQYLLEPAAARRDSLAAIQLATRICDLRSQLLAHTVYGFQLGHCADWGGCAEHCGVALQLARTLGARRFAAENLCGLGLARAVQEEVDEGLQLLAQACSECIEADASAYAKPTIFGALALLTDDPARRARWLAEGEALLEPCCASHCICRFTSSPSMHAWQHDWVRRGAAAVDRLSHCPCPCAGPFRAGRHGRRAAPTAFRPGSQARQARLQWRSRAIDDALAAAWGS